MRSIRLALFVSLLQIAWSGCKARPAAGNAADLKEATGVGVGSGPAELLYHGGSFKNLMTDLDAHEIPKPVWDEFIMGASTGWGLAPFRRGFYGAEKAATTYYFAKASSDDDWPWVISFTLAPRCRDPERIFRGSEFVMSNESNFYRWLKEKPRAPFTSFAEIESVCIAKDTAGNQTPGSKFDARPFYVDGDQPESDPHPNGLENTMGTRCQQLVESYLDERQILVAEDTEVGNSWYARDRTCLLQLNGTPDEVLQGMRKPEPYFDSEHMGAPVLLDVAVKALSSAKSLDEATLTDIKRVVDAIQGGVHGDLGKQHAQAISDLAQRGIRCIEAGKQPAYQSALIEQVDAIFDGNLPEALSLCP